MNWHIGCSGFHYKEWKDVFYPKGLAQKKWFDYYSTRFDSLELNVTFYRFPRVSFLQNWYMKSPAHFLFAVKVPRLITHYKKFSEVKELLADFYGTTREGLNEKLGPVLFQLPPNMPFTEEKMQQIIENMDASFQNVVECRHASWWNKKVFSAFEKHKISFCSISYPGLPDEVTATTDTIYYRFHGTPKLYYSSYPQKTLKKTIDSILKTTVKTVYVYFNNTAGPGAIENAEFIKKYIAAKDEKRKVAAAGMLK
jgi:uncharacterized protein YecE (DUF72 family)